MAATFSQAEYHALTSHQRRAIARLARATGDCETTGKLGGISDGMADRIVALGYAEKGRNHLRDEFGYRLNDKGHLAYGWSQGFRQTSSGPSVEAT